MVSDIIQPSSVHFRKSNCLCQYLKLRNQSNPYLRKTTNIYRATRSQWALKGLPEDTITRENERVNRDHTELYQRKADLEKRIEATTHLSVDIESTKKACELVRSNLAELSFENKRLVLEALNIKGWIDGENVTIEGAIPVADSAIESNIW